MKYKLGDLIELETETNSNLEYGLNDIVGVTISKQMIPTIANLKETSLEKFTIVKPKSFVYNPRTHGKKIGLGYNQTNQNYIATWNNNTFKIKNNMKTIINSDYLYLYFNRDIWDKEACFHAWGSSTVVLSWDSFCEMDIDLPDIHIQEKIVNQYNVVTERIKILSKLNTLLEKIAHDYFEYYLENFQTALKKIDEIGTVVTGKTPSMKIAEYYSSNDIPFIKTPDMHDDIFVVAYEEYMSKKGADSQNNKYLPENTVIMSCIGSAGEISITSEIAQTNQQINAILCETPYYLYLCLKKYKDELLILGDGSTTMININKTDFGMFELPVLEKEELEKFEKKVKPIFEKIKINTLEKKELLNIQQCIFSKL